MASLVVVTFVSIAFYWISLENARSAIKRVKKLVNIRRFESIHWGQTPYRFATTTETEHDWKGDGGKKLHESNKSQIWLERWLWIMSFVRAVHMLTDMVKSSCSSRCELFCCVCTCGGKPIFLEHIGSNWCAQSSFLFAFALAFYPLVCVVVARRCHRYYPLRCISDSA